MIKSKKISVAYQLYEGQQQLSIPPPDLVVSDDGHGVMKDWDDNDHVLAAGATSERGRHKKRETNFPTSLFLLPDLEIFRIIFSMI